MGAGLMGKDHGGSDLILVGSGLVVGDGAWRIEALPWIAVAFVQRGRLIVDGDTFWALAPLKPVLGARTE